MATKRISKKKIEENILDKPIIEKPIEQLSSEIEEDIIPNIQYDVTVIANVKKAVDDTEELKEVVETFAEPDNDQAEKLFTVRIVREKRFFAADKNGKYILLDKKGKYKTVKEGDIISL